MEGSMEGSMMAQFDVSFSTAPGDYKRVEADEWPKLVPFGDDWFYVFYREGKPVFATAASRVMYVGLRPQPE